MTKPPRSSLPPEVGVSSAVDDAVFALKAGQTTAPISTESAVVVARVVPCLERGRDSWRIPCERGPKLNVGPVRDGEHSRVHAPSNAGTAPKVQVTNV